MKVEITLRRFVPCCALAVLAGLSAPAPGQAPTPPKPAAEAPGPLGRIFFTPAQRSSLDVARKQRARATLSTEATEEVAAAPVPQTLTYDGMVRRSDGKTTVWINNRAVNDKELARGAAVIGRVRPDGGVSLQVPQTGRSVDLKPGQSIELLSGTVEEAYSRKPAVTPEPKPEAKPPAKPGAESKPAAKPDAASAERDREEREQQRVQEAVTQALQQAGGAKPAVAPAVPEGPAR